MQYYDGCNTISVPHGGPSLYVKSRVAVDFSSRAGPRVVSDPNEAIGVAIEEESKWRVSSFLFTKFLFTKFTACSLKLGGTSLECLIL